MRLPVQAAIIAALAAGSAFADDWTKTFVVSDQPNSASRPTTAMSPCTPGTKRRLWSVSAPPAGRSARAKWKSGNPRPATRVEITVRTSRQRFPFFSVGAHSIDVDVHAPRQIESNIRTGDGNIEVTGLQGETRLRTGDGNIEAESLGGSLEATTATATCACAAAWIR